MRHWQIFNSAHCRDRQCYPPGIQATKSVYGKQGQILNKL